MIDLIMFLAAGLAGPASTDLLALQAVRVGSALPSSWTVRPVRGQRAPTSIVADSSGERYLRLSGTNTAGWFVHHLAKPVAPSSTELTLTWRVVEAPVGADLRSPRTDDAALRLFVVFASGGFLERIPRTLFYSTGTVEPTPYERAGFQSAALRVIRMTDTTTGVWATMTVAPFVDYARAWGGTPREIVAVGLMQDTEQTRSRAIADVRSLAWRLPHATP